MLKFIFWALLCMNAILFAYGQGVLGNVSGDEREPARLKNQVNGDKLKLVASAQAAAAKAEAAAAAAAAAGPAPVACTEIGNFSGAEARRFEARTAVLELGERQSRQSVPAQQITSHIVFIPPQGSKEAAERKAAELKSLGVASYFVITDNSPMKWAISLGVFKSEAAAQALLATLGKQGVHSARISGRGPQGSRIAFQFRAIDTDTLARLDEIKSGFAAKEVRACQ